MKVLQLMIPAIFAVALVGCGGSAEEATAHPAKTKTTPKTPQQADNYVSPLPDTAPIYTVAMTGNVPPFSYFDDYQVMSGIDVDVIRAIGEEAGFKVTFTKASGWNDMFTSTETGKSDLAMSGISYREERDKKYSLSSAYFFNPAGIAYTDSTIDFTTLNQFKDKKVSAMKDTTAVEWANSIPDSEVILVDTAFLGYQKLLQKKADATISDYPILKLYAKQLPEHKVIIKPIDNVNDKGAHAVILASKNNTKLIEKVNEGLVKVKEKGIIKDIEKKWMD